MRLRYLPSLYVQLYLLPVPLTLRLELASLE